MISACNWARSVPAIASDSTRVVRTDQHCQRPCEDRICGRSVSLFRSSSFRLHQVEQDFTLGHEPTQDISGELKIALRLHCSQVQD